jgi:hypothetical protein
MALDIYRTDNNEYLFGLDDEYYGYLEIIFDQFKKITGIYIDQYDTTILDIKKRF